MAPNVKHISLLSQSLAALKVIRPKEAVEYPSQRVQQQQQQQVDSDSYWTWESAAPASSPPDLFSADRITALLVRDAAATQQRQHKSSDGAVTDLKAENDSYWAEQRAQPQQPTDSASYWAEAVHEKHAGGDYWAEATPVDDHHRESNGNAEEDVDDAYWCEAVHVKSTSDSYWAEGESSSTANKYWEWRADRPTASDLYWAV
jgi:hypothetical protein